MSGHAGMRWAVALAVAGLLSGMTGHEALAKEPSTPRSRSEAKAAPTGAMVEEAGTLSCEATAICGHFCTCGIKSTFMPKVALPEAVP